MTEDHLRAMTDAMQAIGTQSAIQGLEGEQHYVHTAKLYTNFAYSVAEYKDVLHPYISLIGQETQEH